MGNIHAIASSCIAHQLFQQLHPLKTLDVAEIRNFLLGASATNAHVANRLRPIRVRLSCVLENAVKHSAL